MNLGDKLSRLRAGRPYAEVARAADCTAPTIRQIENGQRADPSYRIISALARFYGVSLDWLTDDEQDWPPTATKLDDKIVSAVHRALTPFAGMEGLSAAEYVGDGWGRRAGTFRDLHHSKPPQSLCPDERCGIEEPGVVRGLTCRTVPWHSLTFQWDYRKLPWGAKRFLLFFSTFFCNSITAR